MVVAACGINGYTFKSIRLSCESKKKVSAPPIFISTNPSHVNPYHLRELFAASNLSSHRFPSVDLDGRVEPVDIHKLRIALSHSSVVVSVFSRPQGIPTTVLSSESLKLGDFFQRVMPVKHSNKQLVGFGRAVSDNALTASIHDVMVIPSLRGMGIGRRIVQRIIRILTSRDIYDISALCSKNERLFFSACGFGDDTLSSTTMMYTRTVSNNPEGNQMVERAGMYVGEYEPPLCSCGGGYMRLLRSNTSRNPGRLFYKCPVRGKHAGNFLWFTEVYPHLNVDGYGIGRPNVRHVEADNGSLCVEADLGNGNRNRNMNRIGNENVSKRHIALVGICSCICCGLFLLNVLVFVAMLLYVSK